MTAMPGPYRPPPLDYRPEARVARLVAMIVSFMGIVSLFLCVSTKIRDLDAIAGG
jgi:hypothetical protein